MYSVRLLYLIIMTLYQFLYFNLTYDLIVSHYFDNFFVNFIFLCHSYDLVWLDSVFHNWLLYLIFIMILLHSFTVKKWMVCFSLRLGLKCSDISSVCRSVKFPHQFKPVCCCSVLPSSYNYKENKTIFHINVINSFIHLKGLCCIMLE